MTPSRDEVVARARAVLEGVPEVELAVLFGSVARETAHDGSDADIAVVYGAAPPSSQAELALQARLAQAIGRDVDLVPVERATPATRQRIARDGVLVLARDPATWVRLRTELAIEPDVP